MIPACSSGHRAYHTRTRTRILKDSPDIHTLRIRTNQHPFCPGAPHRATADTIRPSTPWFAGIAGQGCAFSPPIGKLTAIDRNADSSGVALPQTDSQLATQVSFSPDALVNSKHGRTVAIIAILTAARSPRQPVCARLTPRSPRNRLAAQPLNHPLKRRLTQPQRPSYNRTPRSPSPPLPPIGPRSLAGCTDPPP